MKDAVQKRRVNDEPVEHDSRTAEQREIMLAFAHRYCLADEKTLTEQEDIARVVSEFIDNELDLNEYTELR